MRTYEGLVYVSGSTQGYATIDDLDSESWSGVLRGYTWRFAPGLVSIRLGSEAHERNYAIAELEYLDEQTSRLSGRTGFHPDPYAKGPGSSSSS